MRRTTTAIVTAAAAVFALVLTGVGGVPPAGAAGPHVVSVYVDDDQAQPRQGARVVLFYGGNPVNPPVATAYVQVGSATTDATGRVDFLDRADGYYKARVEAGGGWAETWWGGGTDLATAPWFGAGDLNPNPVIGPIATDRTGSAVVSPQGDQFGYRLPSSCYLDLAGQQYAANIFNAAFEVGGLAPGSHSGQVVCPRAAPAAVTFVVGASSQGGDPSAQVSVPRVTIDYQVGPVTLTLPSGGLEVGRTVSGAVEIDPRPASPSFQWLVDGVLDAQASGYYYLTIAERHRGHAFSLRVCVNGSSICSTSASTPVVPGGTAPTPPVASSAPVVTGTPVVGSVLTASAGTWTPAGVSLARQWLLDGTVVPGASAPTYVVRPGDVGRRLSVRVTATNADGSASSTSAPTGSVAPGTLRLVSVTRLAGTARVGKVLRVALGSYAPSATATYAWKVRGATVSRAATLRVRAAWVGRKVVGVVTFARPGYRSVSVTLTSPQVRR